MSPDALGGQLKTHTGRVLGTPAYMSPEQCRGAREIDHRTDVYSLACILFEMLCGRPPFIDPGFGQLIYSHLSVVPPRARSIDPSIDPALDELCARMLAKSADERPQTMRALVAEIDRIAPGAAYPHAREDARGHRDLRRAAGDDPDRRQPRRAARRDR